VRVCLCACMGMCLLPASGFGEGRCTAEAGHGPRAGICTGMEFDRSVCVCVCVRVWVCACCLRQDLERADALLRQAMDHVLASAQVWNLSSVCLCE